MNILRGPSDDETLEAFKDKTPHEIFEMCVTHNLNNKIFQLSIDKGLFKLFTPEKNFLNCAKVGSLYHMKKFILDGVYIDVKNEINNTALIYASMFGHFETVKFLVESGAEIEHRNIYDYDALVYASCRKYMKICNYLKYKLKLKKI
jgi:ankyrin repeat protein